MLSNVIIWLNDLAEIAVQRKMYAKSKGRKYIWKSKIKNNEIKQKFSEEGEKLPSSGKLSSRSSGKSIGREWLYDFTLREFDKDNNLIGIPLVAEIEMSDLKKKGIIYDFNKLLQSDAGHKVFVLQQNTGSDFAGMKIHIETAIDVYKHQSESKLLIACWVMSECKFTYETYNLS